MVWIFKTSVSTETQVEALASDLDISIGNVKWNFDLQDCDRILRIEANRLNSEKVISILQSRGYECVEFPD
jgi:hypothetical protein